MDKVVERYFEAKAISRHTTETVNIMLSHIQSGEEVPAHLIEITETNLDACRAMIEQFNQFVDAVPGDTTFKLAKTANRFLCKAIRMGGAALLMAG